MANDISKLKVDNSTYNIKDADARQVLDALGTAATKDSTNSVAAGSTDLVESGAVRAAIDAEVSSVYHPSGSKTVAELTSALLIASNSGNVYNMTTSGTASSDFVTEEIGKHINIGDNVAIVNAGTDVSPVYKFDLLSGFVDLTNYVQKSATSGLLKNDGSVDTAITGAVSENTSAISGIKDGTSIDSFADVETALADKADEMEVAAIENVYGSKNLLPNNAVTQTINDVTFTVNEDKSVTVNGAASDDQTEIVLSLVNSVEPGTYILSGGTVHCRIYIQAFNDATFLRNIENVNETEKTVTINYSDYNNIRFIINVPNGATANNEICYPMLRLASIKDNTYVPYAKTNKQLTDDVNRINGTEKVIINSDATSGHVNLIDYRNRTLKLEDIYKRCEVIGDASEVGWYRFAITNTAHDASGSVAYELDINIAKSYNTSASEVHAFRFSRVYLKSYISSIIDSISNVKDIDKVRFSYNSTTKIGYLDFHYIRNSLNNIKISINDETHISLIGNFTKVADAPSGEDLEEFSLQGRFNNNNFVFGSLYETGWYRFAYTPNPGGRGNYGASTIIKIIKDYGTTASEEHTFNFGLIYGSSRFTSISGAIVNAANQSIDQFRFIRSSGNEGYLEFHYIGSNSSSQPNFVKVFMDSASDIFIPLSSFEKIADSPSGVSRIDGYALQDSVNSKYITFTGDSFTTTGGTSENHFIPNVYIPNGGIYQVTIGMDVPATSPNRGQISMWINDGLYPSIFLSGTSCGMDCTSYPIAMGSTCSALMDTRSQNASLALGIAFWSSGSMNVNLYGFITKVL